MRNPRTREYLCSTLHGLHGFVAGICGIWRLRIVGLNKIVAVGFGDPWAAGICSSGAKMNKWPRLGHKKKAPSSTTIPGRPIPLN